MGQENLILHVVFDSNTIFGDGSDPSCVVAPAVLNLITTSVAQGVSIRWAVPEMVKLERENFLYQTARHSISNAAKIPEVFRDTWLLDAKAVDSAIERVVHNSLRRSNIEVIGCDTSRVDWPSLVVAAGRRRPPFSEGKTEKGFKDAVIAETFIQLCELLVDRPTESAILITSDDLLSANVTSRITHFRARVLPDIDALKSELNFLAMDIDADTAQMLQSQAASIIRDNPTFWNAAFELVKPHLPAQHEVEIGLSNVRVLHMSSASPVFLTKTQWRAHFSTTLSFSRSGEVWVPPASRAPATGGMTVGSPPLDGMFGLGSKPMDLSSIASYGLPQTPRAERTEMDTAALGIGATGIGHFETIAVPSLLYDLRWSVDIKQAEGGNRLVRESLTPDSWQFAGFGPVTT